MLSVKDLKVEVDGNLILNGVNLEVKAGETHAVMGPNGSGKSTLVKVIAGHPDYKVVGGTIEYQIGFKKRDLLELAPHERAREGVFLAFQYPIEVPGVTNLTFLRASFNAIARHHGSPPMEDEKFEKLVLEKMKDLGIDEKFLNRFVNEGFSGGEKKRNEALQMALMNPKLALLDETDSGLDIDSLKVVAEKVNHLRTKQNAFLLVTHYQRLLNYIRPDFVHVLSKGKIVKTGDYKLAMELEQSGYDVFQGVQ